MNRFMLALGLTTFAAGAAMAQDAGTVTDTDQDGSFSMEELQVAFPNLDEETYAMLDADADGTVTGAEVTAAMEAGVLRTGG